MNLSSQQAVPPGQQSAVPPPGQQSAVPPPGQQSAVPPPGQQMSPQNAQLLMLAQQTRPGSGGGGFQTGQAVQQGAVSGFHGGGPQPLPNQQTISPQIAQMLLQARQTMPGPAGGFHG